MVVITTLILLALVLLYIKGHQCCQGPWSGSSALLGSQLQPGKNKPYLVPQYRENQCGSL